MRFLEKHPQLILDAGLSKQPRAPLSVKEKDKLKLKRELMVNSVANSQENLKSKLQTRPIR